MLSKKNQKQKQFLGNSTKADLTLTTTTFIKNITDTLYLSPFTPVSDQDKISPYNINTMSSRQVMRINKNINWGMHS